MVVLSGSPPCRRPANRHVSEQLSPELAQLSLELAQLSPELCQLSPELRQLRAELAQLSPELGQFRAVPAQFSFALNGVGVELTRFGVAPRFCGMGESQSKEGTLCKHGETQRQTG